MRRFYLRALVLAAAIAALQAAGSGAVLFGSARYESFPYIGEPNSVMRSDGGPDASDREVTVTRNSLGLRGRERTPSDTYSIATIGNSTTLCFTLEDSETWSQLLEDKLNRMDERGYWVVNTGLIGGTTRHYPVICEYVLPEIGGIDVAVIAPSPFELNQYLSDRASDETFGDPHWMNDPEAVRAAEQHVFLDARGAPRARTIGGEVQDLIRRWVQEPAPEGPPPGAIRPRPGTTPARDGLIRLVRARRLVRQTGTPVTEPAPDFGPFAAEVRVNLERTVQICRERGIEPILATSPALWQVPMPEDCDERLQFGVLGGYGFGGPAEWWPVEVLLEGLRAFNGAIRSTAEKLDVRLVELDGAVPRTTEYFWDDIHFTVAGAERVAEVLAGPVAEVLGSREEK